MISIISGVILILKCRGLAKQGIWLSGISDADFQTLQSMCKKYFGLFLSLCSFCLSHKLFAQKEFANHWIDYGQDYFKISTLNAGVQSLNYTDLKALGFPENAQADHIQVFYRGEEIAVKITDVVQNKLSNSSQILFYSEGNTGKQDSLVYQPHGIKPKLSTNLYSDETLFYVTVSQTQLGKRIGQENTAYGSGIATNFGYHQLKKINEKEWSYNNLIGLVPLLQHSYYEDGECWTGSMIRGDSLFNEEITLSQFQKNTGKPIQFAAYVNGRYGFNHDIVAKVAGEELGHLQFYGFGENEVKTDVGEAKLNQNNAFVFSLQGQRDISIELYSLNGYTVRYPRKLEWNGTDDLIFEFEGQSNTKQDIALTLSQAVSAPLKVWDIGDASQPIEIQYTRNNNTLYFTLENSGRTRRILLSSSTKNTTAKQKYSPQALPENGNYLIISHKALWDGAQAFADYRASAAGGNHQVVLVDIEDLKEQFNFGERGPLIIRNYLAYFIAQNPTENYLLLIGNGVSFPNELKASKDKDFIPTFGYPGSDVLLSAGLGSSDSEQETFRTGRIPAKNTSQVLNYLNKVKETENQPLALYRKKLLFLSGGRTTAEIQNFRNTLSGLAQSAENSSAALQSQVISKETFEEVENVDISSQINSGIGLMTFMGHASPTHPDMNIGFVSDPYSNIANQGKYPMLYFTGCGVGNVFYRYETLAQDWLFGINKGALAIFANSFWSYPSTSSKYLNALYQTLFDESSEAGNSIGQQIQYTNGQMMQNTPDAFDKANVHQLVYLGDPSLKLFPSNAVNLNVGEQSLYVQSDSPEHTLSQSSNLNVGLYLANTGWRASENEQVDVLFTQKYNDGSSNSFTQSFAVPTYQDSLLLSIPNDAKISEIEVQVDPNNAISESNENDNKASLVFDRTAFESQDAFPENLVPDKINPVLLVKVNNARIQDTLRVFAQPKISATLQDDRSLPENAIQIFFSQNGEYTLVPEESLLLNKVNNRNISAEFQTDWQSGLYNVLVVAKDAQGNASGQSLAFTVEIVAYDSPNAQALVTPNPSTLLAKIQLTIPEGYPISENGKLLIYDETGRILEEQSIDYRPGFQSIYCLKNRASGIYFYSLELGKEKLSGRIVLH
ncbi:C25 family cysteine peptidase [Marinilongibacter aquaticus]|uniref:putative type IX secretion system sortase PorU2 n=1 Tax=Marinilongibacter aquaticus TaxID=2975157 RepID=UPI0021BDDD56|nr:C25 family cysteine peptidase [Marinilongibacter aquaticus]UBM60927.1 C25 family cysteine peptidase [Marinilongibacter aquaticus]